MSFVLLFFFFFLLWNSVYVFSVLVFFVSVFFIGLSWGPRSVPWYVLAGEAWSPCGWLAGRSLRVVVRRIGLHVGCVFFFLVFVVFFFVFDFCFAHLVFWNTVHGDWFLLNFAQGSFVFFSLAGLVSGPFLFLAAVGRFVVLGRFLMVFLAIFVTSFVCDVTVLF